MKLKKINPRAAGFLQAVAVVAYISALIKVMQVLGQTFGSQSENVIAIIMLSLFVFSAALTGALVFGLPAYLILNKKTREGLTVFGSTLVTLFVFIVVLVATFA